MPVRNGPCPCGSGRKYKNCCLKGAIATVIELRGGVELALRWLQKSYPDEIELALATGFFRSTTAAAMERARFMPAVGTNIMVNALEWLLAEGVLQVEQAAPPRASRTIDLVLGPGGPRLSSAQRAFLNDIANAPLRLYEVLDSTPGEGLLVKDLIEEGGPELWVEERLGSRQIVRWDVMAARAVAVEGRWWFAGALYLFPQQRAHGLLQAIRATVADARRQGDARVSGRVSRAIIDAWLDHLLAPVQVPTMVDQGTGEPLMLVTDHYEVLDWDALAAALEAQPDVEGDRGEGWTRFVELGGGMRRSLLAINIGQGTNRIEPFARTLRRADEGRRWLQGIAGTALRFLNRDVVDSRDAMARGGAAIPAPRAQDPLVGRSPQERTHVYQQVHEQIYRNWADEPIPLLGGRTPRESARTAAGREAVLRLLKEYESAEERRARGEGRGAVDFGFLWERVGIERSGAASGADRR